ncbi:MAG: permease prefix domain 1-containing protein [Micromonosporaceae bacterium]
MGRGPIDEYVRALDRRLVGPRRAKRDLVTEARDSLVDAAEAYQAGGLDRLAAERRAVAEFGAPDRIAPQYQRELAAGAARRLALLVTAFAVGGLLLGDRMWQGAPWADRTPSRGYLAAAVALDHLPYVVAAVTVLVLLGMRQLARRGGDPRRLCRALSLWTLGALGLSGALGGTVFMWTVMADIRALTWPPMAVGGVLLAALTAWQMVAALRCLRYLRGVPGPQGSAVRPAPLVSGPGTC